MTPPCRLRAPSMPGDYPARGGGLSTTVGGVSLVGPGWYPGWTEGVGRWRTSGCPAASSSRPCGSAAGAFGLRADAAEAATIEVGPTRRVGPDGAKHVEPWIAANPSRRREPGGRRDSLSGQGGDPDDLPDGADRLSLRRRRGHLVPRRVRGRGRVVPGESQLRRRLRDLRRPTAPPSASSAAASRGRGSTCGSTGPTTAAVAGGHRRPSAGAGSTIRGSSPTWPAASPACSSRWPPRGTIRSSGRRSGRATASRC